MEDDELEIVTPKKIKQIQRKEAITKKKEIRADEKEIEKLLTGVKLERKTNIKSIEQPKNPEFKKIKASPIIKKGNGILGLIKKDKVYAKQTPIIEILEQELAKPEPDLNEVKRLSQEIKEKGKEAVVLSSYKPPLLEMIRADGRIEWFEGAKAGTLQINRSDEKVAYIDLRKDKLLTDSIRNEDGTVIQKWICYENDQNPLPANNYMDSHGYFSNLEEIMMAKKDWKTEQLKARGDLYFQIFIGIAIILAVLFVVAPMFGFNVIDQVTKAQQGKTGTTNGTQTNENASLCQSLSIDELGALNNIRMQKGQTKIICDTNSGG